MRVFLVGATGFIGRALLLRLRRAGHEVTAWVRSEERARALLGDEVELLTIGSGDAAIDDALSRCDAVVNLAGEPLFGARWTAARRRQLVDSRVAVTEWIVRALEAASPRPPVFVSGSAVGLYGDRGSETLTEESAPGSGFLATLCREWEAAANRATSFGVRVVNLRTGIVLGREGGALAKMLTPFRFGVGGPVGSGKQYLSWIHLHDLVEIIATALEDSRYRGAVNATAPVPATSRDFARSLGRALRRPAFVPTPAFALRMMFGESATVLLSSQRAIPVKLGTLGFQFAHPRLDEALGDLFGRGAVRIGRLTSASPAPGASGTYLKEHRPKYLLRSSTTLDAPVDRVFAFFSHPRNLGLMTPSGMKFQIHGVREPISAGSTVDYRLRVGPVPVSWRTRIEDWQPGRRFVDSQEHGPYRTWWHEHHFRADGNRTVMEERVYYSPRGGVLGWLANQLFVKRMLRRIFGYRVDAIRLRFGS